MYIVDERCYKMLQFCAFQLLCIYYVRRRDREELCIMVSLCNSLELIVVGVDVCVSEFDVLLVN